MRCADLVDEHAKAGEAPSEDSRRAGMDEVDVGQEERARLGLEAGEQGLHARRGAGIRNHPRLHLPGADHTVAPQVHRVDYPCHPWESRIWL